MSLAADAGGTAPRHLLDRYASPALSASHYAAWSVDDAVRMAAQTA